MTMMFFIILLILFTYFTSYHWVSLKTIGSTVDGPYGLKKWLDSRRRRKSLPVGFAFSGKFHATIDCKFGGSGHEPDGPGEEYSEDTPKYCIYI